MTAPTILGSLVACACCSIERRLAHALSARGGDAVCTASGYLCSSRQGGLSCGMPSGVAHTLQSTLPRHHGHGWVGF